MYPVGIEQILIFIAFIWLLVLSFLYWREKNALHQLFPKEGARDIRNKVKELIDIVSGVAKDSQALSKHVREIAKDSLGHMQKVAVLRYNPYNDTGGDQSFSLVLLDGKLNGTVFTSLHSRAGTRTYIKVITKGTAEVELSKEEKKTLEQAIES